MIKIMKYGEIPNEEIFSRGQEKTGVEETVSEILENVRKNGDSALKYYAERFDSGAPDCLEVTEEELEEAFDISRLNKSPGIFDINKLTWFNAEYVRRMTPEDYLKTVTPWFDKVLAGKNMDYKRLAELMQSRTEIFSRVPEMIAFLAEMPEYELDLYNNKKMKSNPEVALDALRMIAPVLESIEDWSEETIHDTVMAAIAESGKKNGAVLWPMRIAISGLASTPGGAFEIAYLLGKEETLRRLNNSVQKLAANA